MNRGTFTLKTFGIISGICMMLTTSLFAVPPEFTLKGKVIDGNTRQPIGTAQISVPNRNVSAVIAEDGSFTLHTASPKDVLRVSAYDYNRRDIPIQGRDSIVIELYPATFSNYFGTVQGLLGAEDNVALASGIKTVGDRNVSTAMVADEVLQSALGGDVRAITRSGQAGVGASLFVRGLNSINANAQPLFVIDGVIWDNMYDVVSIHKGYFSNPLDVIDVNDIESITVVKDGASIYGSKAANGLILIKTKRAQSMVTKITFNFLGGITTRPRALPMMESEDYRLFASDMLGSMGATTTDADRYGFLEINQSNPLYNTFHNSTNWDDEIYQNGSVNSYMINVDGGDEKAMYYLSLGYTGGQGSVKTTDYERIHFRLNSDLKLTPDFDMAVNLGFTNLTRTLLDDGVSNYSSPTWISRVKSPFLSPKSFTATGDITKNYAYTDEFGIGNPVALIYAARNNVSKHRVNIQVEPKYHFGKEWTLSSMIDYSMSKNNERTFVPMYYTPIRTIPDYGLSQNEVSNQVFINSAIVNETKLEFNKKLDADNHLNAVYGWRYYDNIFESDYENIHNTGSNHNTTISNSGDYRKVDGIFNHTKSLAHFLSLKYNFAERYFLNAAVSMDASSRFGKDAEDGIHLFGSSWGLFPSVGGAWLVTAEEFMKNLTFVDLLKIRAGYGITGNDGIKDYEALAYFTGLQYISDLNGIVLSKLENTKIQWETTAKLNAGFDIDLFKNRLRLGFDYFISNTSNLLVLKDLPEISGLEKYWANDGKLRNTGYELSFEVKALNLKKFQWEAGASVGHYKNEIVSLPEGKSYTTSVYDGEVLTTVGQPVGVFYGYKTKGVFSTNEDAAAEGLSKRNADGAYSPFMAGDIHFEEVLEDGIINEADKQIIGDPNPDIYGNIFSKWTYGNWTLNAIFTYSYGNDVYNYYRSKLEAGSDFNNQTMAMLNRWTAAGQTTAQPKATYGDPMGNARFSDRWIEDGSYLRLKTLSLAYDVPIKDNIYVHGLNIWVSANNLFTLTKYLGMDPEFSSGNSVFYQGVDAGLLPLTQSFYVGIKLNL